MKNEKSATLNVEAIVKEVVVDASIKKVWKAITDKDEMKQWYFDLKEFKPEVGFEFQFYGGTEENQYLHLCKVTEVIPNEKLTYSWRYDGYPGISYVTFELHPEGNGKTIVKLTHSGLETFGTDNPDFARENFEEGWNSIIGTSLKHHFDKQKFISTAEININAPVSKVWKALTTPELVKQYLFGTNVTSDWKEGSPITYKGEWEGKQYEDKGKILKIIPNKLFVSTYWSSMGGVPDSPENYKTVTDELFERGSTTTLKVTQDNNRSQQEADHSTENWKYVLSKLKELLEKK